MTLSDEARQRLADIVERQPTKNGELQELWDMDSGSEVHQYLESELKEYYYRNDDSLICATPEATALIDGEDSERVQTITVTPLQQAVVDVIAAPDEESQSVVAVLHALREVGEDPEVDDVRSALRSLADKGIVETIQKTVPTFRLVVARENLDIELAEA
jgi:sugar-specific transcriptional regulator TrmB